MSGVPRVNWGHGGKKENLEEKNSRKGTAGGAVNN
jgi:hypothetical protein